MNKFSEKCFALLDDCDATIENRRSRLYTQHVGTLLCRSAAELPQLWEGVRQAWQRGEHAVALLSYELGGEVHGVAPRSQNPWPSQILLFKHCAYLSAEEVSAWLVVQTQADTDAPTGIAHVQRSVDEKEFAEAISRIHAYINAGDTYQVNYTYRLRFDVYGSPIQLYRMLRARQPVPYGALIRLPNGGAVLSLSPELFIRHEQGLLNAKPMKGTAPATGDAQRDALTADMLSHDIKNRAENLMIVDLLRNDCGRIAVTGSVNVPRLFEVDRYGAVLQMTSTISARLREQSSLDDIFAALYPCGSITGAPKHRTMQIIRELEPDARGIYTGAIGWLDAPKEGSAVGDFCFSVPIRTLVLQAPSNEINDTRRGEMGVGAGIVYDSDATAEFEECQLKARFLTGLDKDFELFETIYATKDEGCRHLDRHLQRLRASAEYFAFAYDEEKINACLQNACASLPNGPCRIRLALHSSGDCTVQAGALSPIETPAKVLISEQRLSVESLFLRHKTTVRKQYDKAWREAEAQGAFDMLFLNDKGELTEGGRSNVFVKLGGRWYTPPLACGVLPGVMRSVLLEDRSWSATERCLTLDDLNAAEEIVVCNALRGALQASL